MFGPACFNSSEYRPGPFKARSVHSSTREKKCVLSLERNNECGLVEGERWRGSEYGESGLLLSLGDKVERVLGRWGHINYFGWVTKEGFMVWECCGGEMD